jgi:hypothetical protein
VCVHKVQSGIDPALLAAHLTGLAWKEGMLAIISASSSSRVLNTEGRERVEVHSTGSCTTSRQSFTNLNDCND